MKEDDIIAQIETDKVSMGLGRGSTRKPRTRQPQTAHAQSPLAQALCCITSEA